MTKTYTLTAAEAAMYDSNDDEKTSRLMVGLRARFGRIAAGEPVETEVRHPNGFVVSAHTARVDRTAEALDDVAEYRPRGEPDDYISG